ncbi:MAG: hypothetical protein ACKVP0_14040 [Pirellulaceae bacterium]
MSKHSIVITACSLALVAALATQADAGWGRYRVSTYYGVPGVPVVQETVVVRGYRPVVMAPAPVVISQAPVTAYYSSPAPVTSYHVSPAPVTTYYSAPAVYVGPRGNVRAAYYAPAPATYYYGPTTATYYDRGFPRTVILP